MSSVERVFASRTNSSLASIMKALRVHQWAKNLLLFVPFLLAHQFTDVGAFFRTFLAFLCFSLCASGVYVMNDLLDLPFDRQHPHKKLRPFAAGTLSIKTGVLLIPVLLSGGLISAALLLPPAFVGVLVIYLVCTTAYSLYLKRLLLVDVLVLAGLYSLRVLAGGIVAGVYISQWLVAFSVFFFLSLALLKRYAELNLMLQHAEEASKGRDYRVSDIELLRSFGSTSGLLSVLVLALYTTSNEVVRLYEHPVLLWLIGPLLLYWIMRMWLLAHRGQLDDDPIVFTVKDPISYVMGALVAAVAVAAAV